MKMQAGNDSIYTVIQKMCRDMEKVVAASEKRTVKFRTSRSADDRSGHIHGLYMTAIKKLEAKRRQARKRIVSYKSSDARKELASMIKTHAPIYRNKLKYIYTITVGVKSTNTVLIEMARDDFKRTASC